MNEVTRKSILDAAEKCVCADRETQYGAPEDNFKVIADLWTAYKESHFDAHDVGIMLALLKIARIASGQTKEDNYIDLAGYAACAGEIALRKPQPDYSNKIIDRNKARILALIRENTELRRQIKEEDDIGAGGTTD